MEGDKGDGEPEYQRQQRHLVEPARHKGEPDRQEARAGGKGDGRRRYEIGADDQRGRGDGILQKFDEIAEWHPCQARADLAANGKLRQNDEFIDARQLSPAGQAEQGR